MESRLVPIRKGKQDTYLMRIENNGKNCIILINSLNDVDGTLYKFDKGGVYFLMTIFFHYILESPMHRSSLCFLKKCLNGLLRLTIIHDN